MQPQITKRALSDLEEKSSCSPRSFVAIPKCTSKSSTAEIQNFSQVTDTDEWLSFLVAQSFTRAESAAVDGNLLLVELLNSVVLRPRQPECGLGLLPLKTLIGNSPQECVIQSGEDYCIEVSLTLASEKVNSL
jgi:hypothetical protein